MDYFYSSELDISLQNTIIDFVGMANERIRKAELEIAACKSLINECETVCKVHNHSMDRKTGKATSLKPKQFILFN